jgi:hypothetical protein
MESSALHELIMLALTEFTSDLRSRVWYGRENELVNWFAHGHLLRVRSRNGHGVDPLQVGIEVAVPQIAGTSRRRKPDVRKDLVVWHQPRATCWSAPRLHAEAPLAVLEWKSMNNVGVAESEPRKRREFAHDVEWLCSATEHFPDLLGYAVFVDLRASSPSVECQCVASGIAGPEKRSIL